MINAIRPSSAVEAHRASCCFLIFTKLVNIWRIMMKTAQQREKVNQMIGAAVSVLMHVILGAIALFLVIWLVSGD